MSARRVRIRRVTALLAIALVAFAALELLVGSAEERARHGADLERIEIDSEAVGEELTTSVVVPDGGGERPLLVFLHGRNGDEDSNLSSAMYDALDEQGDRAPIVAFPDGGDDSYWHDRADGAWGAYVADEIIPTVSERFDVDPERVAIGGISMGGFGALDIARRDPGRFCAVGAHSPALWESGSDSAAGAFDDAADFERHDVVAAAGSTDWPPLWIDAGEDDPFQPGIQAFLAQIGDRGGNLSSHTYPGGHEGSYWSAHWDEYMRFYANRLAACRR